jgi:hypothetical protein
MRGRLFLATAQAHAHMRIPARVFTSGARRYAEQRPGSSASGEHSHSHSPSHAGSPAGAGAAHTHSHDGHDHGHDHAHGIFHTHAHDHSEGAEQIMNALKTGQLDRGTKITLLGRWSGVKLLAGADGQDSGATSRSLLPRALQACS